MRVRIQLNRACLESTHAPVFVAAASKFEVVSPLFRAERDINANLEGSFGYNRS
jgi:hypothetical protein